MEEEFNKNDPLGFTKEVAGILTGLGATNLKKAEELEISFDDLKDLSDEDLKFLEVGDNFDYERFGQMRSHLFKKFGTTSDDTEDALQMLAANRRQLSVINIYLECLKKLIPNAEDCFIDRDANLRGSEAMLIGTDCILEELENLKQSLNNYLQVDEKEMKEIIEESEIDSLDKYLSANSNESNSFDYGLVLRSVGVGFLAFYVIKKFIIPKFINF